MMMITIMMMIIMIKKPFESQNWIIWKQSNEGPLNTLASDVFTKSIFTPYNNDEDDDNDNNKDNSNYLEENNNQQH